MLPPSLILESCLYHVTVHRDPFFLSITSHVRQKPFPRPCLHSDGRLDTDRWPWLESVRAAFVSACTSVYNEPSASPSRRILIGCSALRLAYRDFLRSVPAHLVRVTFVYLRGSSELLRQRIENRKDHFMKAKMLDSQLETLEEPKEADESVIVQGIEPRLEEIAKRVWEEAIKRELVGRGEE